MAFRSAFDKAEKSYGRRAFSPVDANLHSPEMAAMREAGVRLHLWGGLDAMFCAAYAMVASDQRRFYGLGVLLSVVWSDVGDWPAKRA